MEIRWLEGKWEFGKYKLQYREGCTHDCEFMDVPVEKELPEWCEHITMGNAGYWTFRDWRLNLVQQIMFCPLCGKERPHF